MAPAQLPPVPTGGEAGRYCGIAAFCKQFGAASIIWGGKQASATLPLFSAGLSLFAPTNCSPGSAPTCCPAPMAALEAAAEAAAAPCPPALQARPLWSSHLSCFAGNLFSASCRCSAPADADHTAG